MKPTRLAPRVRKVAQQMSLPAPSGGINARDSLALMPMTEAVRLENLFPLRYGVRVRKGWRRHVTGISGNVDSLITHSKSDGTQKLFAAAGGYIYDATTAGAVGAAVAPAAGTYGSNRWQSTSFANTFGTYTVAVNGVDTPIYYNGTAWANLSLTADAVAYPSFSSLSMVGVAIAHRRLWFIQKDSGYAWYLPVDQVSGQVTAFHVGELFPRGGYLQAIATYSTDGGAGINEYTVFVSSQGDIAVYQGFDPNDATNWILNGVYAAGPTIGRRCVSKFGGDLMILTENGVMLISAILGQTKTGLVPTALSDKIQQKFSTDAINYGTSFGWESTSVARHQMMLVNVPSVPRKQYVMNLVTGAWCEFYSYEALCWATLGGEPFFGASGYVAQAWYGDTDDINASTGVGTTIQAVALQAFNYFGAQAQQKRWTLCRPTFNSVSVPGQRQKMAVDFDMTDDLAAPGAASVTTTTAHWDSSVWDTDLWGDALQSVRRWYSLNSLGYCGAFFMKLATRDETTWVATDFTYEAGGVL